MGKISFDASKVEMMFSAMDDLAIKKLDTTLLTRFIASYTNWKQETINSILNEFEFENIRDREAVETVLKFELIPKLIYDRIYIVAEKFRKTFEEKK